MCPEGMAGRLTLRQGGGGVSPSTRGMYTPLLIELYILLIEYRRKLDQGSPSPLNGAPSPRYTGSNSSARHIYFLPRNGVSISFPYPISPVVHGCTVLAQVAGWNSCNLYDLQYSRSTYTCLLDWICIILVQLYREVYRSSCSTSHNVDLFSRA